MAAFAACSMQDYIRANAEHYVRKTYSDVDRILYYSVDTVTIGDNLDHRIKQAQDLVESYRTSSIQFLRDKVPVEEARLAALDSLKNALAPEILNHITAYDCCVAYNVPSNLVYVQLDEYGNLLNITKDIMKKFLNPGQDAPGYFELNDRFWK